MASGVPNYLTKEIVHARTVDTKDRTRPPLTDLVRLAQVSHSIPLGGERHHFREATSLSIALSGICSVRNFFSLFGLLLGPMVASCLTLVLERLQLPGVRNIHVAELGFPLVKCRRTDPVFSAYISSRDTAFVLLQDRDDLLFAEPRSFHNPSLSLSRLLPRTGGENGSQDTNKPARKPGYSKVKEHHGQHFQRSQTIDICTVF